MNLPKGIEKLIKNREKCRLRGENHHGGDSFEESDYYSKKILVAGSGGIGCELLKSVVYSGFNDIDIIDLDDIELSNLNRQFLFRKRDIGRSKSSTAAKFLMNRRGKTNRNLHIRSHHGSIDFLKDSFGNYDCVFGCFDSNEIRKRTSDFAASAGILYIDGGTDFWEASAQAFPPGFASCFGCRWPLRQGRAQRSCTIASKPRNFGHCLSSSFEELKAANQVPSSEDQINDDHLKKIHERAKEKADEHKIKDILSIKQARDYFKNSVPAIASSQAISSSLCVTLYYKCLTDIHLNNLGGKIRDVLYLKYLNPFGFLSKEFPYIPKCSTCYNCAQPVFSDGDNVDNIMNELRKRLEDKRSKLEWNGNSIIISNNREGARESVPVLPFVDIEIVAKNVDEIKSSLLTAIKAHENGEVNYDDLSYVDYFELSNNIFPSKYVYGPNFEKCNRCCQNYNGKMIRALDDDCHPHYYRLKIK